MSETASRQPNIGQLLTGNEMRDAIHIAIAPVMAGESIDPGDSVYIDSNGLAMNCIDPKKTIGIADPFLPASVNEGDWFYAFMTPNTVTSLRHEWQHPAFPSRDVEVRLAAVCQEYGWTLKELKEKPLHELYAQGKEFDENYDKESVFWTDYAAYTGRSLDTDERWIRCGC